MNCTKTQNEPTPTQKTSEVKSNTRNNKSSNNLEKLTYTQVGDYHNLVLARATTTLDVNAYYTNNTQIAKALNDNSSEGLILLAGWGSQNLNISSENVLKDLIDANYHFNPSNGWDVLINQYDFLITAREKQLLARAKDVFNIDFSSMTITQTGQYIHEQALILLNDYNNISWNQNEGELAGGLLNIMKASSNFWKDQARSSTPNHTTKMLIHVDCIGYLAGWGNAVWNDYWNGNLNSGGQGKRIASGLIVGAAMSTAGLVRNW